MSVDSMLIIVAPDGARTTVRYSDILAVRLCLSKNTITVIVAKSGAVMDVNLSPSRDIHGAHDTVIKGWDAWEKRGDAPEEVADE